MHFRPLHRVVADEKTAGGIIIPDTAKEQPMEGEVVAVGPGAERMLAALHVSVDAFRVAGAKSRCRV